MPNATVPAAALGLPSLPHIEQLSRRQVLAAGTAGAVFTTLIAPISKEPETPFAAAMARHRRAFAKLKSSESSDADVFDRLCIAEFDALRAVALTPCSTDAELIEKLRYLFVHGRDGYGLPNLDMSDEHGSVFLALDLHLNPAEYA